MNTNPKLESSALRELWRERMRNPTLGPTEVFTNPDAKFSVSVDGATSTQIIDLEFPRSGPKSDFNKFKSLKGVSVRLGESTVPNRRLLSVTYDHQGNDCAEFWPHFAEDILVRAAETKSKASCAKSVAGTLLEWKKVWPSSKEASEAVITGLFGELVFLQELTEKLPLAVAVAAWHGPAARDHDFSIEGITFEVKASKGSGRKVTISNLHQLDDAGVKALYLVHVPLRSSDDTTHSLESLGGAIRARLQNDPASLSSFTLKLGKAGWFKASTDQRKRVGFRRLGNSLYPVTADFPRILERDLAAKFLPGIEIKTYQVRLTSCPRPLQETAKADLWTRLCKSSGGEGLGAT